MVLISDSPRLECAPPPLEPLLPEWQSHPPDPDIVLTRKDFLDLEQYSLKGSALRRMVSKLTDPDIGFVRLRKIHQLYPDVRDREAFVTNVAYDVFRYDPMAFIATMERDLPVHPHGEDLWRLSQQDPEFWPFQLHISHSQGYRDHGNRFVSASDDIVRGHYAHHEYAGEELCHRQVVLFLVNGYWGFQDLEGTEPVVMDMEAYRRWNNMQPGARYLAKQPKTIGGDRDLVFPSDDARRRFSFISRTNYGEEAEILILNNLRVGHSRLPGRRFSVSGFQRPLYQCSFNIGLQGNIPVIDYLDDALDYKKEPLWNPLQQIFYRLSQAVRNPFE